MRERLVMPYGVRQAIVAHARVTAPDECCGLLVGRGTIVEESVPLRNVDPAPRVRYAIDPSAHVAVIRSLRQTGASILGCYHSHPRGTPRPSPSDVAEAYYPEFVWVIVSLPPPGRPRVRAWRIADGQVRTVRLAVAGRA